MEQMAGECDAIVIGGGPGGAAAAITLAQRGHRVVVLEAARFPRHHVGESLVYLWPLFEQLGVAEELDRTHVHKRGSSRFWGHQPGLGSTHIRVPGHRNYSLLVERASFDKLLLDQARAAGATVCEGHRVTAVHWERGRPRAVSYRSDQGAEGTLQAPFVVDASGRARLIARQLRLLEPLPFYPRLALYGYYRDAARLPGEDAGNVLVEGTPEGWAWYIPLHTGEVSVGVCVAEEGRKRLAQVRPARFFQEQLAQTQQLRAMLRGATLVNGPIGVACDGYRARRYAGPGWLLVGDAGHFFDPIWSFGVSVAMHSGFRAGLSIDAVLHDDLTERAALDYHDQRFRNRVCGLDWLVFSLYRANRLYPERPFWQRCQRWPGARRFPTGLRARLGIDIALEYYQDVFRGIGATNGRGEPLFQGVDLPMDRQARLDWPTFLQGCLRLAPGVRLRRAPVLRGGRLTEAPVLRLAANAGEGPLPEDVGLDWPVVLARMAAGASVAAVVEQPQPDDYGSAQRHLRQTNVLLDLYLQGFLALGPANGDPGVERTTAVAAGTPG